MPKSDWRPQSAPVPSQPWLVPPEAASDPDDEPRRSTRARTSDRPAAGRPRKHFVAPHPYTQSERDAIAQALADSRLGDATARDIFIGAIAYHLAVLKAAPAERAAPEPQGAGRPAAARARSQGEAESAAQPLPELPAPTRLGANLADQAQALAGALDKLTEPERAALLSALAASDPFRRAYGPGYLAALQAELMRIADAAAAITGTQAEDAVMAVPPGRRPQRDPAGQKPSPIQGKQDLGATDFAATDEQVALAFLRHAASVYEQCFEARPDPAPEAPFARVLSAIAAATGIAIPTGTALLRRALEQG